MVNNPLYGYTTIYLSIYHLMDNWVVSILILDILIHLDTRNIHGFFLCVCGHIFCILSIFLGVKLMGHMLTLCLTFWGNGKMYFQAFIPFTFSPVMYEGSHYSHLYQNLSLSVFWVIAILLGIKWYLIVLLIFTFLWLMMLPIFS